ncbi:MAG TPA: guanylate kinase [bacterium]|nr:guanylate kinase [bacterium]
MRKKETPQGSAAQRGTAFVISAPSGTGKTTLVTALRKRFPFLEQSVSCTTRPPRTGEKNGRDYLFLTEEAFKRRIAEGAFLEWAQVYGHYYGTPKDRLLERIETGHHVVCAIDVQGAVALKNLLPDEAVLIFVLPPSLEELRRRIRGRALDDEAVILRRLDEAKAEMRRYVHYDHIVVNDDLERAASLLSGIVATELYCSTRGNRELIERMLG